MPPAPRLFLDAMQSKLSDSCAQRHCRVDSGQTPHTGRTSSCIQPLSLEALGPSPSLLTPGGLLSTSPLPPACWLPCWVHSSVGPPLPCPQPQRPQVLPGLGGLPPGPNAAERRDGSEWGASAHLSYYLSPQGIVWSHSPGPEGYQGRSSLGQGASWSPVSSHQG